MPAGTAGVPGCGGVWCEVLGAMGSFRSEGTGYRREALGVNGLPGFFLNLEDEDDQGAPTAPLSNQRFSSARSSSVIPVALFSGISFSTTACW